MPSEGPQSVSTASISRSAPAAESLQEYGAEQWQPASGAWQRGQEGQTHQSNMSRLQEEALMGQNKGSYGFIPLPARSGNFIFLPQESVINTVHQTTPQQLLPGTQPMTAAQHVKHGRSYQHLAALTHPSSWASLVHPHHPRLIQELPCCCLCLLGDQPLQHCCAVSRVRWPFIDSQSPFTCLLNRRVAKVK